MIFLSDPVVLTALWVVAAGLLSRLPTKRKHWPLAVVLILAGAPILVLAWMAGLVPGLFATVCGALVLRWPLYRLGGLVLRAVRP